MLRGCFSQQYITSQSILRVCNITSICQIIGASIAILVHVFFFDAPIQIRMFFGVFFARSAIQTGRFFHRQIQPEILQVAKRISQTQIPHAFDGTKDCECEKVCSTGGVRDGVERVGVRGCVDRVSK